MLFKLPSEFVTLEQTTVHIMQHTRDGWMSIKWYFTAKIYATLYFLSRRYQILHLRLIC